MTIKTGVMIWACMAFACLCPQAASAGPALLYDAGNGRVLYAEDADYPWYPASLTKMMTAYVVFEGWKSGKIDRNAKIVISANAAKKPKMRLGLKAGKDISWDDAVIALIMKSANDIASAIAEAASGSEDTFVAEMNKTADRLGMRHTKFVNPHGLPGEGQHTTAKDMAILTQAIARDFPQHLGIFRMSEAQIGNKRIATHNPALVNIAGGNGMKTGFTCSAGYNIVASATREGRTLVAIVLGEKTKVARAKRMTTLLEHGFTTVAWKERYPAPLLETLPASFKDRDALIAANLVQRLKDCTGPEEETEELIAAAPESEVKGEVIKMVPVVRPTVADLVLKPDAEELQAAFTRETPENFAANPIKSAKKPASGQSQIPPSATAQQQKTRALVRRPPQSQQRQGGNSDSSFSFVWP